MRCWSAKAPLGVSAVNGMADLGEEDRVRHRRVVEFLGEVVFFHPEGPERAIRRLVRRVAGRDRPMIALHAVNRDGHQLFVLVNGDGDFGLSGAASERQRGKSNDEGTHTGLGLQPWMQRPLAPSICTKSGFCSIGAKLALIRGRGANMAGAR